MQVQIAQQNEMLSIADFELEFERQFKKISLQYVNNEITEAVYHQLWTDTEMQRDEARKSSAK